MDALSTSEFSKLLDRAIPDKEAVEKSLLRLRECLKSELDILAKEEKVFPEVNFSDLEDGKFPADVVAKIRKRGVVVIRGVFEKEEAEDYLVKLKEYMEENGEDPADTSKTFYDIFWSKPQFSARTHPNMVATQKALMGLWQLDPVTDEEVDLGKVLMYADRLRIRKPNDETFSLPPHIDSGYLEAFQDKIYRMTFQSIFSGCWEEYDPFLVNCRGSVSTPSCSFFRTFQGWTALTASGPGSGTLKVLPILKEVTAYLLLRAAAGAAAGVFPGKQLRNDPYFPDAGLHEELFAAMVSAPEVQPGDTVWWHPDILHGTENKHDGELLNAVLYIAGGPECPTNRLYSSRMRSLYKLGLGPPDFAKNLNAEKEFNGRVKWEDLDPVGKRMMGDNSC